MHAQLQPGWAVTESKLLPDAVTGESREVDIVAESRCGPYDLFLSIECRDHARAADVTWVEAMATKHDHLPTSKLVLWSSSGFTGPALRKAAALKISTVSQRDASDTTWPNVARQLVDGTVKYLEPNFEAFVDVQLEHATPQRHPARPELMLRESSGSLEANIGTLLAEIRSEPEVRKTLLDHAPEDWILLRVRAAVYM